MASRIWIPQLLVRQLFRRRDLRVLLLLYLALVAWWTFVVPQAGGHSHGSGGGPDLHAIDWAPAHWSRWLMWLFCLLELAWAWRSRFSRLRREADSLIDGDGGLGTRLSPAMLARILVEFTSLYIVAELLWPPLLWLRGTVFHVEPSLLLLNLVVTLGYGLLLNALLALPLGGRGRLMCMVFLGACIELALRSKSGAESVDLLLGLGIGLFCLSVYLGTRAIQHQET